MNRPISYSNINIDQLNQTNAAQTRANLAALANTPPAPFTVARPNPMTTLQNQTQQQSNSQINNSLQNASSAPVRMSANGYQRLLELRAFMNSTGVK